MAEHFELQLLGTLLKYIRQTFAVNLVVVEDVDLLHAHVLGPLGGAGALQIVGRHDAGVILLAGRPIDLRLARLAKPGFVRPTDVLAGLIINRPALFKIGIDCLAAPELYGPM